MDIVGNEMEWNESKSNEKMHSLLPSEEKNIMKKTDDNKVEFCLGNKEVFL